MSLLKLLELADRVVRIDSQSSTGNEEMVTYLSGLMSATGFEVKSQQVTHAIEGLSKRQFNLVGYLGDSLVDRKTKKGLLLLSHLDTADAGIKSSWGQGGGDPHHAIIRDEKVFGLGTADAKLDFLCKFFAAKAFRESKLKIPVYLAGTCGEQYGMFGTRYLIQSKIVNPAYVFVGKPTDLQVVYQHKSHHVIRLTLNYHTVERGAKGFNRRIQIYSQGRSTHTGLPSNRGINAISQLLQFLLTVQENGFDLKLTRLDGGMNYHQVPDSARCEVFLTSHQLEDFKRFFRDLTKSQDLEHLLTLELGGLGDSGISFLPSEILQSIRTILDSVTGLEKDFRAFSDSDFDYPYCTFSLNKMVQSHGRTALYFDARLLPSIDSKQLTAKLHENLRSVGAQFPGLNMDIVIERSIPPLVHNPDHPLVEVASEVQARVGLEPKKARLSISSEAGLFQAAGYDVVAIGPGSFAGNVESPTEHNRLDQLEKAIAYYMALIEKVCL